jgi:hypothetical protein
MLSRQRLRRRGRNECGRADVGGGANARVEAGYVQADKLEADVG